MDRCEIRPARPEDAPALAPLLAALGDMPATEGLEARLGATADDAVLVAERDGAVVGFVAVHAGRYLSSRGRPAQIEAIAVAHDARRSGVGRALLDAAEAWARETGCTVLWLFTGLDNAAAHELYRRSGWGATGLRFVKPLDEAPPGGRATARDALRGVVRRTLGDAALVRRRGGGAPSGDTGIPRAAVAWPVGRVAALLASEADREARSCFAVLAATGLSVEELCDLQWADVDLDGGSVDVRRPTDRFGRPATPGFDRSPYRPRRVPIDTDTRDALRGLAAARVPGRRVVPFDATELRERFRAASARLGGVAEDADVLRHTHATVLVASGCSPRTVAERLGIGDPDLVVDLYWPSVDDLPSRWAAALADADQNSV